MSATGATAARPFATGAAVAALALLEGARLARHPLVLAGAALSVAAALAFVSAVSLGGRYLVLTGALLLPLCLGTLLAANGMALRDRRSETGELHGCAPAPHHARALAQLLALVAPATIAAGLVAAGALAWQPWDGLPVAPGRTAAPTPAELAQGPLAVAVCGALGVALGRWLAHPVAGLAAAIALFAVQMPAAMWNLKGAHVWFMPLVNPALTPAGSSWPCSPEGPYPCVLQGMARAQVGWHLLYLAGLGLLLAAVALARHAERPRRIGALAAVAAVALAVGGVAQQP